MVIPSYFGRDDSILRTHSIRRSPAACSASSASAIDSTAVNETSKSLNNFTQTTRQNAVAAYRGLLWPFKIRRMAAIVFQFRVVAGAP